MVINVSFINKNVQILFDKSKSKNSGVFSKISNKISKKDTNNTNMIENDNDSIKNSQSDNLETVNKNKDEIYIKVLKKVEQIELPSSDEEELSSKQLANIEAFKQYKEHIKKSKKLLSKCLVQTEDAPQKLATLEFDTDSSDNLESFLNNIFSLEEYFSKNFTQDSKKMKKSLILPDEIIGFDALTIPALSPFQVNSNIKLKLSLDFKDFHNLNTSFKQVLKAKPNVTYAIQFVKKQIINEIIIRFKNLGVNFKSVNFYSSCLSHFYTSKLHLSKQNALIVKVDNNHTTILAISHGFLVYTFSLSCGTSDIVDNKSYRYDEHSKKMNAYKYICYKISSSNNSNNIDDEPISLEKIEKDFPQTRTNLLAPVFQIRNVYSADIVKQKMSEILDFLKNSEMKIIVDRVIIDTNSEDVFELIKTSNSEMVTFDETQIFDKVKSNPLLKFSKIKNNSKKFSWSSLWKKTKNEA